MQFAHKLYLDTEVRQPEPTPKDWLGTYGLDKYARHRHTHVLLFPYAIDDGPIGLWDVLRGSPPAELREAFFDPDVQLIAHNAQFDRVVLMHRGWEAPVERWHCTSARARIHGLPSDLDRLSKIYRLGDDAKQAKRGKELIELFCVQGADPAQHPVEWLEFCDYAIHDVAALRRLDQLMPSWSFGETEQRVYHLDQRINDRGFKVDLPLAQKMIEASDYAQSNLNARTEKLSSGLVSKGTQVKKLNDWFANSGFELVNMRAETLRKALRDDGAGRISLTPEQREMIEIRLLSAKSSTAKCKTALNTAGPDGRIRYTISYAGGGRIGRFSHKGFQPGNMPRPSPHMTKPMIFDAIEALQNDCLVTIWGDESMSVCADALRGLIVADEGKQLISVDWSNIEGRMLAWYANEEWKLQVYRDSDAGIGADGYRILGYRMTGKAPEEITDFERQGFKGADLSMGYEGGVGAYVNIANSYQVDLVELAKHAPRQLPREHMEHGEWDWHRALERTQRAVDDDDEMDEDTAQDLPDYTLGLPQKIYVACAAYKHGWRDAHPATTRLWINLLECAKAAVAHPGKTFHTANGKIHMLADSMWLAVQIPSGRKIMFAKPKLKELLDKNGKPTGRTELTAMKAPHWYRKPIYGGLIANAITQGGCRDILVDRMLAVDEAGFPIIMHIHDDIITEVPENDPDLTLERQTAIMLDLPGCYEGLPLAASGFVTKRLYKG